jgi:hypothetical protein
MEGAGKSTLAAAFARRGGRVLSDDLAPLVDRGSHFDVHPGYPRVRLWPRSVEMLFGDADALPRMTESWEKRFLPLDDAMFAATSMPLAAIYVLSDERTVGPARIEPMASSMALVSLIRNSYASRLLDRSQRAREFDLLGRVAQHLPVRLLTVSSDVSQIDALFDLVAADICAAPVPTS